MRSTHILLAMAALAGCATMHDPPEDIGESSCMPPSLSERGLTWLATEQSSNGYWGVEEETRVLLTSVVIAAFLSHGETPASVERALRYLVTSEDPPESAHPMVLAPRAALAWALGDSYAMTRNPLIGDRFRQVSDQVAARPNNFSPFTLWAAGNVPTRQTAEAHRTMLRDYQAAEPNLLTYALIARVSRDLDHSPIWWKRYDQAMGDVIAHLPENWRGAEYPMLTLVALCDVFAEASVKHAEIWWKPFWTNVVTAAQGSAHWSPTAVGVEASPELQTFKTERDRTVYTTAMMVNAMNQVYRFRRARHGDPEWEQRIGVSNKASEDIGASAPNPQR